MSASDMWPVTSVAVSSSASSSTPTPYRPFETSNFVDEFRPNPFPSPEPPAPPPSALSPPLQLGGPNWNLSPPAEDRSTSVDNNDEVRTTTF